MRPFFVVLMDSIQLDRNTFFLTSRVQNLKPERLELPLRTQQIYALVPHIGMRAYPSYRRRLSLRNAPSKAVSTDDRRAGFHVCVVRKNEISRPISEIANI